MNNVIERTWLRKGLTFVEDLRGTAFTYENKGHTFIITGFEESGGDEIAFSGTVSGSFIRSDGTTTALTGAVSDGKASITLVEECYGVSGRGTLTVFVTSGGQKTAIYSAVLNIVRSSTAKVSPGVAADVSDLINRIDAATASVPAEYTALLASIAADYSNSKTYAKGDVVWYNGSLYQAKQAITKAESWTASHWQKIVLTNAVNAELATLTSNLSSETTARTNADAGLQSAIDAEATARQGADTGLQNAVDTEAQTRQTADTNLQNAIDAEAQARQTADTAEAEAREAGDTNILNALQSIGLNIVDGVMMIDPVVE